MEHLKVSPDGKSPDIRAAHNALADYVLSLEGRLAPAPKAPEEPRPYTYAQPYAEPVSDWYPVGDGEKQWVNPKGITVPTRLVPPDVLAGAQE